MRYITKLHLENWHYIEYKTIDLSNNINFLTGQTGAGKSTIIDALQLIILGDLRGQYFNKAANENSKRKLIEYLKGMIEENSDDGKKFVRDNMDFSSYIVIEVYNSIEKEHFCLGIVFDVSKDSSWDSSFFMFKGGIPERGFLKDNIPLTIKGLKEEYGSKVSMFSTEEYKERFLNQYMGKLNRGFYDIFKRAVAFKPPASIEEFIEEFICDDIKIDVDDMVIPIKIYKKLEVEVEQTEKQIEELESIKKFYEEYVRLCNKETLYNYIFDRSNLEKERVQLLKYTEEYNDFKQAINYAENAKKELVDKIAHLSEKISETKSKIDNADETKLKKEIEELKDKISRINRDKKSFDSDAVRFERWIPCLDYYKELDLDNSLNVEDLKDEVYRMRKYELDFEGFSKLNVNLKEIKGAIQKDYDSITIEMKSLADKKKDLEDELGRLSKGISYPGYIQEIKEVFQRRLKDKYNEDIEVNVLADLIDVKDVSWLDALEGYMNHQKFYLIVEPKYYQDVIEIYNSLDKSKYYGVGIVDVEKIMEDNYKVLENSLAKEVITENKYARVYIDYLLGRVAKCTDIEKIRDFKTSITKDCFLYKGYIARRLNPESYQKNRCIGAESRRIRIRQIKDEILIIDNDLINKKTQKSKLKDYLQNEIYEIDKIKETIEKQKDILCLTSLNSERDKKEAEYSKIDMFYIEDLKKKYNDMMAEKVKAEKKMKQHEINVAVTKEKCTNTIEKITNQEKKNNDLEIEINNNYSADWISSVGESSFDKVVSEKNNYSVICNSYDEKKNEVQNKKINKFSEVKKFRREYCSKFSKSWDYDEEDNSKYENQLEMLIDSKLPEYKTKVAHQREKAYEAFRSDLLSRLKDAIDKTEEEIKFINRSLSNISFGEKKYKFIVRPKKEYRDFYDMLKNDFLGLSIGADLFENQYKDTIQFLFDLIVNSTESLSSSQQEELRKRIDLYTDYKTYLEFDMEQITNDSKSDLSKTLTKNSGGETQSPFFIAVLAAFANHYRIYNKKDNDAMRLIVFDEAFNKMDEEHAEMSIKLLRKIGLQAIIAAPDDKIPVIRPFSDEIIYVKNENKKKISIVEFTDNEIDNLINGVM